MKLFTILLLAYSSHVQMFIPSIMSQGSQEQQQKWLPQCFNLNIIGTYTQVSEPLLGGGGTGLHLLGVSPAT